MANEEVKRSLHFMIKVVVADATGEALVEAFAEEEVATAEEAGVDVEVAAAGRQNPVFLSDNTLTRSMLFLAMMIR